LILHFFFKFFDHLAFMIRNPIFNKDKGSVKNNLAFLHHNFTISLTDLHSQKSSK